ncbi:MAG: ribonuclease III [Oscillospiraceae bacterium]|jgi:ribonuclease-3|nr:ribonuclease III [Oscillospiraceae bacterium]
MELQELEEKIGHKYKNARLLKKALTHSSYSNEGRRNVGNNERLEFLGDSVLSLIVSDYLYEKYSGLSEGELTKLRAKLVCEKSLDKFAADLELDRFLILGRGEDNSGGRKRPSIRSDAFEAVLASLYIDGGMEKARAFVMRFIRPETENIENAPFKDYKTQLQEISQQTKEEILSYVMTGESGPDHDKRFFFEVRLNSNVIGSGEGRSKKEAEQFAAKEALRLLGQNV